MELISTKLNIIDLCKIDFIENTILQINIFDNIEYDKEEIDLIVNYLIGLTKGEKYKLLVTTGQFSIITICGLKALSRKKSNCYATATAYVITSVPQKLMANFYLNTFKPQIPIKFFDTIEDAKTWLKTL